MKGRLRREAGTTAASRAARASRLRGLVVSAFVLAVALPLPGGALEPASCARLQGVDVDCAVEDVVTVSATLGGPIVGTGGGTSGTFWCGGLSNGTQLLDPPSCSARGTPDYVCCGFTMRITVSRGCTCVVVNRVESDTAVAVLRCSWLAAPIDGRCSAGQSGLFQDGQQLLLTGSISTPLYTPARWAVGVTSL